MMHKNKSTKSPKANPFVAPHVISQFLKPSTGEWLIFSLEQESLPEHFFHCLLCQRTLIMFVEETLRQDQKNGFPEDSACMLLEQLRALIHETLRAFIGPYIDVCKLKGEREAKRRFPELAAHLKECDECRQVVNETLSLLTEIENSERLAVGGKRL
jgi:hypothetical protein